MDSLKSETNTELSSSMEESQQTTPLPEETETTQESSMSLREALSAALETEDAPEESVPDAEVAGEQVIAEPEAVGTPVEEPLIAPEHWPAAERERFNALPRETQDWLLQRNKTFETDVNRRLQELSSQRKEVEEFNRLFEPYKQQLELAGRTPTQVVQQLLAAQRYLESSPAEALKWLAQSYNLNLSELAPREQEYVDPQYAALQRQIQQLQQQNQLQQQTTQQAEAQRVLQAINDFKEARTPDGQPKYPHFETLKAMMAPLVAQGKSLEEAYNEVKYVLPEERERIAEEAGKAARAEALKKAEEERKAKAKEAKSASSIIRSRGVGAEKPSKPGTLRSDLEEAMRSLQGRI